MQGKGQSGIPNTIQHWRTGFGQRFPTEGVLREDATMADLGGWQQRPAGHA